MLESKIQERDQTHSDCQSDPSCSLLTALTAKNQQQLPLPSHYTCPQHAEGASRRFIKCKTSPFPPNMQLQLGARAKPSQPADGLLCRTTCSTSSVTTCSTSSVRTTCSTSSVTTCSTSSVTAVGVKISPIDGHCCYPNHEATQKKDHQDEEAQHRHGFGQPMAQRCQEVRHRCTQSQADRSSLFSHWGTQILREV